MEDNPTVSAHEHCSNNERELERSEKCGCFYCLEIYPSSEINQWIGKRKGFRTAICPKCGIDSVIGSASGYPLKEHFLQELNDYWF
jgi:acetone carboxylase gamma subunit